MAAKKKAKIKLSKPKSVPAAKKVKPKINPAHVSASGVAQGTVDYDAEKKRLYDTQANKDSHKAKLATAKKAK